ncbi:uncharacterized protein BROUX77_007406 [Berkeleyomyces rouxiae]|uniref:uncharacterized protein n=1 Tax=Berkeleyomyces rouxiae TaxID=2035830 RepID=UPI003B79CA1E
MSPSIFSVVSTALAVSHVALSLLLPTLNSAGRDSSSDPNSLVDVFSETKGVWSIKQARSTESSPDGPLALASLYTKYGIVVPGELDATMTRRWKRDSVSAAIKGSIDNSFAVSTRVGDSNKRFNLIFDTSSAGVWMLAKEAISNDFQEPYTPGGSISSGLMQGYSWQIEHLNGKAASGDVYRDSISFGTRKRSLGCQNQAIQVARSSYGFETAVGMSGVMGMAFSSRNPVRPEPQLNFFDNVVDQLEEKVFTVDMKHFVAGTVEFGSIDSDKYTGDIGYTDVFNEDGYWNFTVGGLTSKAKPSGTGTEYAVADTTSPLVMVPMPYIIEYYGKVPGARWSDRYGGVIFPCDSEMPDFTFDVGGVEIAIPALYMKFSIFDGNGDYCFGGIQSSHELGFSLIGSIAFKSAFVVFDPVKSRIGWARKQSV